MNLFSFPAKVSPLLVLIVVSFLTASVGAQPSGGPYGPLDKTYAMPKAANVFVVAPDGKADAAGSLEAPTTLESAFARAVSGDAIVLRGGIYRSGSLVLNQGISLQPYRDEKPVVKGSGVAENWTEEREGVWSTSWNTLFPSEPMFWWRRERHEASTPLHRFNNDMVFFNGEFLQSAGGVDELDAHSHYIDYKAQKVYIGRNPAGNTVEITAHETAITRVSKAVNGKTTDQQGPKIRGITFSHYAWTAFSIEGKRSFTHLDEPVDEPIGPADPSTYGKQAVGTLLENVTISYCGRVAGYFRGDGLVIRNSLISDTGTEGIYVIGSSDVVLERNIIKRNNIENISGYYASAVKIINQTHDVIVRENLVIMDEPNSVGVWYDVGNRDGVFVNNYVEGAGIGFFFEISQGATVAGNVFVNNPGGVWILNSADVHLYNNTFVDTPMRFWRTERSAQGDHFGWHPATGPNVDERHGHSFVNNLLVASTPALTSKRYGSNAVEVNAMLMVDQTKSVCEDLTDSPLNTLDGNIYVRPESEYPMEKSPLVRWINPGADDCSLAFSNLAEFGKLLPEFSKHSLLLNGTPRSVFNAPDIGRYELLAPLSSDKSVAMPAKVRKILGWSKKQAATTVGAYPQ